MSNYTGRGSFSGTVLYNGDEYEIDIAFKVYGYYSPGTMYRRNGDPGDPPEDEIVDVDVDIYSCEPVQREDLTWPPVLSDEEAFDLCEGKAWELADHGEFTHDN